MLNVELHKPKTFYFVDLDSMRIFDKYYGVLELKVGSSDGEIKSAYRKLAKLYHPDKSGDPGTRNQFIDVNEAYEILMKRDEYVRDAILRYQQRRDAEREKHRRYGTSQSGGLGQSPNSARQRAETYADLKFKEFEKSPVYRTAVVFNSVFDYAVFGIGIFMIVSPFIGYYTEMQEFHLPGQEPEFHVLPIVFGIAFLYMMWYFLIKNRD